jgi:creatinine amidohydrolase
MTVYNWQNTTFEIKKSGVRMGILPVAAAEQHGDHLPVGTDRIIIDTISQGVAEALSGDVFLLPTMPLGTSAIHGGTSGTVWLSERTLYQVVYDVVESMYEHDIDYVAVINNHGGASETTVRPRGNYIVKTAVRQLNYDYPHKSAIWVQPFTVAKAELLELFDTAAEDIHAGEVETSLMLHLASHLVKGTGEDHIPPVTSEYLDYLSFNQISPSGVWGRPGLASAEQGATILDASIRATVAYIESSFAKIDRMRALKQ